jgi:hypothetical protein
MLAWRDGEGIQFLPKKETKSACKLESELSPSTGSQFAGLLGILGSHAGRHGSFLNRPHSIRSLIKVKVLILDGLRLKNYSYGGGHFSDGYSRRALPQGAAHLEKNLPTKNRVEKKERRGVNSQNRFVASLRRFRWSPSLRNRVGQSENEQPWKPTSASASHALTNRLQVKKRGADRLPLFVLPHFSSSPLQGEDRREGLNGPTSWRSGSG